jgi:lipoyl(octanoyl) transferase
MSKLLFKDLGLIKYKEAWDYQEELHNSIKNEKVSGIQISNEYLLFCEHPNVYTIGKSGNNDNLLLDYLQLQAKNVEFFNTNRGGDITYHGPGQIVGYPIIDLDSHKLGVKKYIWILEEAIINTLKEYDIVAGRMDSATGVWLDTDIPNAARKITAIGVKVSRAITMHGFAFNVNTDLQYFNYINPCGFTDKGVTSLAKELGKEQDINEVKTRLKYQLERLLF